MPKTIILTLMGADRPGLVAKVAATVADHGGNWLESRLVRLGGQFAGVLRVEAPEIEAEALVEELRNLRSSGLNVTSHVEEHASTPTPSPSLVKLSLLGSDRPGILKAISVSLSHYGANIEELSTERVAAPMSGELLFQAAAAILIPPGTNLEPLRQDLERIASDLMVDLQLHDPVR